MNWEIFVLILYFTAMLGIGVYFFVRSKTKTDKDYFLGGKSMGPWVTAMSAQASDMSAWLLMGLPGVAYLYAGGDSNDHAAVVQAILDEAERLVREGIDEDYYQRLRRANFGTALKALNSFEAIAVSAAEGCFEGYDPFRFPEVYDGITSRDLVDFIRENICESRMALSLIEPKEDEYACND